MEKFSEFLENQNKNSPKKTRRRRLLTIFMSVNSFNEDELKARGLKPVQATVVDIGKHSHSSGDYYVSYEADGNKHSSVKLDGDMTGLSVGSTFTAYYAPRIPLKDNQTCEKQQGSS